MIISKTPVRISFLGGGTDYPEYLERNPGIVLGTAINKYSYITVKQTNPFFDYNYRISYSVSELVDEVDQIKHPSVKACLRHLSMKEHFEIHYIGDLPARTGLGSSSSFTVGLLKALFAFKNIHVSKEEVAKHAIYIEREVIKENVGWQDQIWASFGGLARIDMTCDNFNYKPVCISAERKRLFKNHLLLFYTGAKRYANDILQEQIRKTTSGRNDDYLKDMYALAAEGEKILYDGNLSEFGRLLHENWKLKKGLSNEVTNGYINDLYDKAVKAGASGGKILGAGGGGFMLVYADPEKHDFIKNSLSKINSVDFDFDSEGTQIIYYKED